MKVLQINAVYGTGSTGIIVKDISELASSKGIEVSVAYASSRIDKSEIPNGYRIGNDIDHKMHAVLCRINGKQAYFSNMSTQKLLKYMDEFKPDVVHLHNLHSNFINLNMLLRHLAKNKIRTIITLHDCWFYTGGCFHYTSSTCERWKNECGNCPRKNLDTPSLFKDQSKLIIKDRNIGFRAIEELTIVGVSKWISNEAKLGIFAGRDIETIYNGIDCNFYKITSLEFREKYSIGNKFVIMGMANKWFNQSNMGIVNQIKEVFSSPEYVIVIVGNPDSTDPIWKDNILLLPHINSREELRNIYCGADVFVNLTREESLSLVNIEAQACGTPVITFDNTGASETVDYNTGIKVQTGNAIDVIEAIKTIKERGKNSYREHCIEFIKQRFDKTTNYLSYIRLYQQ